MKRRLALVLAVALGCAGCVDSVLSSHAEAPRTYRLAPPEASTPPDTGVGLAAGLSIGRPRAPASLDTERIAVMQPGSGFDYFAGIRWAEPAPQMLQQLLARAITRDAGFASVVVAPSRVPAEYALDLELRRFEAVYATQDAAPAVAVAVQATLVDVRSATRVASFQAEASSTATSNRRDAVVSAFQDATDQAITQIVRGLREGTANLR